MVSDKKWPDSHDSDSEVSVSQKEENIRVNILRFPDIEVVCWIHFTTLDLIKKKGHFLKSMQLFFILILFLGIFWIDVQLLNESQQQFSWYDDVSRTSSEEGMIQGDVIQEGMIQRGMIQEGIIPTGSHTEVADDNYAVKSVQSKFTISKLISTSYASTMSY